MIGSVRMFDRKRGFGYITSEEQKSVFFHAQQWKESGLKEDPREGEKVSFDVVQAERGPRATNLARV